MDPNNLIKAAQKGNLEIIQNELSLGVDVNAIDGTGKTALVAAIEARQLEAARLLLDNGAAPHLKVYGKPALHATAESGYDAMVSLLLDNGADIHQKDNLGQTALVAGIHHSDVVRVLLSGGADVNQKIGYDTTAIHDVMNPEVARLLVQHGANVNAYSVCLKVPPLHNAIAHGLTELVRTLLSLGANVNMKDQHGHTPLHVAAQPEAGIEIMEILIQAGAEVNAPMGSPVLVSKGAKGPHDGCTPLHWAALHGNTTQVQFLLANGANPLLKDAHKKTAYDYASKDSIKKILQKSASSASSSSSKLPTVSTIAPSSSSSTTQVSTASASASKLPTVSTIAPPSSSSSSQVSTALANASYTERAKKRRRFNAYGISNTEAWDNLVEKYPEWRDPIKKLEYKDELAYDEDDPYRESVLSAIRDSDIAAIEELIKDRNAYPENIFVLAAKEGNLDIVKYFIEVRHINKKVDVETLAEEDRRMGKHVLFYFPLEDAISVEHEALIAASEAGHLEVARYLVSHNANPQIKNKYGLNSINAALENGHIDIVKLFLEQAGIKKEKLERKSLTLALISASALGKLEDVIWLLEIGAPLPQKNTLPHPVVSAAIYGEQKVVEYFIDRGIPPQATLSAFKAAFKYLHIDLIKYFLSIGINHLDKIPQEALATAYCLASKEGELDFLVWLDEQKIALSEATLINALETALENAQMNVIEYLSKKMTEPFKTLNKSISEGLCKACQEGLLDKVQWFVEHGADLKKPGSYLYGNRKPIEIASRESHNDIVEFLKSHKAASTKKSSSAGLFFTSSIEEKSSASSRTSKKY